MDEKEIAEVNADIRRVMSEVPAELCGVDGCVFLPDHEGDHSWAAR